MDLFLVDGSVLFIQLYFVMWFFSFVDFKFFTHSFVQMTVDLPAAAAC